MYMSVYQLTTMGIFYGLNCFGHVIYTLQTHMYQNIIKLLNHPNSL